MSVRWTIEISYEIYTQILYNTKKLTLSETTGILPLVNQVLESHRTQQQIVDRWCLK